ncbi:hypothetical protein HUN39_12025 [Methylocystis sp. FS]|uniref:hypothetical protein n=1 Tax=Methylocystis silviterrae TaxID=2743612 RepID=UPI00158279E8|nr:hypothetical protein [Methylocystis silviterrae]NUJ80742.1 hypothetical protein [Methylocystis silviterrae]
MVKASQQHARSQWINVDALYAAGVLIWIVVVWACAYYVASDAIADESAGVGGNSFLLAASLATAGLITAFSLRELFVAYKRLGGKEARNQRE